jgi:hypothetical protein
MTRLSPSKDTRTAKASHWFRQTNFQWSPTTLSFGEAGDRDWHCRLSARTCKLINDAPKYPDPTIRNNIAMCFAERALLARVPNYRPASLPTPMMAGPRVPPAGRRPVRALWSDPCVENYVSNFVSAISTPRQDPAAKLGPSPRFRLRGTNFTNN